MCGVVWYGVGVVYGLWSGVDMYWYVWMCGVVGQCEVLMYDVVVICVDVWCGGVCGV